MSAHCFLVIVFRCSNQQEKQSALLISDRFFLQEYKISCSILVPYENIIADTALVGGRFLQNALAKPDLSWNLVDIALDRYRFPLVATLGKINNFTTFCVAFFTRLPGGIEFEKVIQLYVLDLAFSYPLLSGPSVAQEIQAEYQQNQD